MNIVQAMSRAVGVVGVGLASCRAKRGKIDTCTKLYADSVENVHILGGRVFVCLCVYARDRHYDRGLGKESDKGGCTAKTG